MKCFRQKLFLQIASVPFVLAVSMTGNSAASPPTARASVPIVAYVDHVYPAGARLEDVVRINRGGQDVKLSLRSSDLAAGDAIYIKQIGAAITIRLLATNELLLVQGDAVKLKSGEPVYTVPRSAMPGLMGNTLAWFVGVVAGADYSRDTPATTRGLGDACYNVEGKTDEPTRFAIPALFANTSDLAPGNRALYIAWRGGAAPFSISLFEIKTSRVVAERKDILNACAARLPPAALASGRYRLTLTDANGASEVEDNLDVGSEPPGIPTELARARIPESARKIYYATWLASQDSGRWVFEAQQIVSEMDCHEIWVREWLSSWGDVSQCDRG